MLWETKRSDYALFRETEIKTKFIFLSFCVVEMTSKRIFNFHLKPHSKNLIRYLMN